MPLESGKWSWRVYEVEVGRDGRRESYYHLLQKTKSNDAKFINTSTFKMDSAILVSQLIY